MAKIIVKGEWADVEIISTEDFRSRQVFTLACDRGAWCSLGPSMSADMRVIVVLACQHADTEH